MNYMERNPENTRKIIEAVYSQALFNKQWYMAGWADREQVMANCARVEYSIRFARSCGFIGLIDSEELQMKARTIFNDYIEEADRELQRRQKEAEDA